MLHKLRKLAVVHRASPLNLAGHAVVPNLLSQVGDGLLQTHVEAQALAEVVPHLQEQGHFAPHAGCCPLHIIHPASLTALYRFIHQPICTPTALYTDQFVHQPLCTPTASYTHHQTQVWNGHMHKLSATAQSLLAEAVEDNGATISWQALDRCSWWIC